MDVDVAAAVPVAPVGRAAGRWLGWVGLGSVLVGLALVGWLHRLEPRVDPVRRTISEYALGDHAWLFNTAVLAVAIGSAATLAGLIRAGVTRPGSLGSVGLLVWTAGLAGVVVFPKHNWARGASMSGDIHRMLSLAAFVALPLAAVAIGWAWRRGPWAGHARTTLVLGVLSALAFLPIPAAIVIAGSTNARWWQVIPLGAVERILTLTETVTLLALTVWALRASANRARRATSPRPGRG